jgi:alkaline phosphatase D
MARQRRSNTRSFSRDRRTFLRLASAGAAGFLVGCGRPDRVGPVSELDAGSTPDSGVAPIEGSDAGAALPEPIVPPEETQVSAAFPMGLSAGDVSATSAVLWTRYGEGAPVQCSVWEMEGERYARVAGKVACEVADAGFIHVDVQNLRPGADYRYVFFELEGGKPVRRSAIGRFRAALPADSLEPLVFGAISCVKLGHSFAPLMRAAQRADLDAFLLLGDTAYNDGAITVAQYRASWLASLSAPEWKALRASTSVFGTWDDHEVNNDWNPESTDAANVRGSRQVWFENLPVRRNAVATDRIYRSTRWGKTAELFALDCRGERQPSRGKYISDAQMGWLKAGLAESPAVFKIILNSVPIGEFPYPFTDPAFIADRWAGYPAQREEILRHIEQLRIPGVLWVSGDFHLGSMGHIASTGLGSTAVEVLAGPGAQTANLAVPLLQALVSPFDFVTGINNYVALHLNPATRECRVVFHDGANTVLASRIYRP